MAVNDVLQALRMLTGIRASQPHISTQIGQGLGAVGNTLGALGAQRDARQDSQAMAQLQNQILGRQQMGPVAAEGTNLAAQIAGLPGLQPMAAAGLAGEAGGMAGATPPPMPQFNDPRLSLAAMGMIQDQAQNRRADQHLALQQLGMANAARDRQARLGLARDRFDLDRQAFEREANAGQAEDARTAILQQHFGVLGSTSSTPEQMAFASNALLAAGFKPDVVRAAMHPEARTRMIALEAAAKRPSLERIESESAARTRGDVNVPRPDTGPSAIDRMLMGSFLTSNRQRSADISDRIWDAQRERDQLNAEIARIENDELLTDDLKKGELAYLRLQAEAAEARIKRAQEMRAGLLSDEEIQKQLENSLR